MLPYHCFHSCFLYFSSYSTISPLFCLKLFFPFLSAHSQHVPPSALLSSLPISCLNPFHHLLSAYLSPITPPSLLHHSIFVLVQLQKWDLAVTNLLAKPPRAPCGGASSQRTRDWLNLGKTLSGWPSWLDLLPDNKFPPPSSTVGRYKCHVVHFHDTWCPGLLHLIHIARIYFLFYNTVLLFYVYMPLTLT